jgi:PAS domain S-box-containing protein
MLSPGAAESAPDEKLRLVVEASATLLGSLQIEDLLPRVLELARKLNAAEACAIWRVDPKGRRWKISAASGLSAAYRELAPPADYNLDEAPFCFDDVALMPMPERRRACQAEGIRSLVAMPMRIGGQMSGTLVFYYRQPHHFSDAELRVATALANLAASAVETAELERRQERSRAAAERARHRAAFLAEASEVLASSLEYETTLAAVARLAVPHIADWCAVEMAQPDGTLKQLALAHIDPAKVEWARELGKKYPPDANAATGSPGVVRTGAPVIVSEITGEMLAAGARDAEHLALLRALGLRSYMCVPLKLRHRVLGAISFVSSEPERRYGREDLALAEDLARRAAIAVDNSLLYASVQRERAALEAAVGALRENEQRLRMALDAGRMGIWEWDLATNRLTWSDTLAAMYGLASGEFDGRYETFLSLVHPEDRKMVEAAVARSLSERSYYEAEFRVVYPDGSVHWMAGKGQVLSEGGKAVRMVGLGMDMTERRRLEEKLRDSQRLESIGLLAGGIAHDFNNLLTGVMGSASLALEILPPQGEASRLMENVVGASERLADLTQQLLAYSGKGQFVIERIDLSVLVRRLASLLDTTIPKLVTLELDLEDGLPFIEGDISQIQQVVMNLVINAAEAMSDRSGRVMVKTGLFAVDDRLQTQYASEELKNGEYVCLEVHDTGCGMDEGPRAKIFDPFFTTKFTGRGLGLAAVSGIVRGHRGAIRVYSAPGQGSTFRVLLPARSAPQRVASEPETEDLRGSGLVLVIDDEQAVRNAAVAALYRYGYRVATAKNGEEGAELFGRCPGEFAAVLLDLTMPVMGGDTALRTIRRIRPDVPVIASSGYSETEAVRRMGCSLGPGELTGFLQKPYTPAALAQKVREALLCRAVKKRTSS